jgi:NADH dehydrogenase
VGGGPTGLETAGALHELYNYVLQKEYGHLRAKVILIEATDRLLGSFPETLRQAAYDQLTSLGVEIILDNPVQSASNQHIELRDGRTVATYTLIWAAGIKASPLAQKLNVKLERGGRVPIDPTLKAKDIEQVYVIGDMAYLKDTTGNPYPQLIPVAKQQGKLAAANILKHINSQPQASFMYRNRGIMATIGRSRAVTWIYNRITLTGYTAWIMWLGLHLIWLLGFRNRASVLIGWIWNYFTYDRSVRIILEHESKESDSASAS